MLSTLENDRPEENAGHCEGITRASLGQMGNIFRRASYGVVSSYKHSRRQMRSRKFRLSGTTDAPIQEVPLVHWRQPVRGRWWLSQGDDSEARTWGVAFRPLEQKTGHGE